MTKEKKIPSTVKLREELQAKDKEFEFKDDIFGMTLLTNPGYISGSRNIMFTSHLRQFVNLENPDYPRVFTNYENIVGKHSTGYKRMKNTTKVIDKIRRYNDGKNDEHIYTLFTYDEENDKYDVITKKNVENLTEKFGYSYNNEVLDSKEVGDNLAKDEVVVKTQSYDENMNYCYGKNAKFMYLLEPDTIEDAVVISESFSKRMISKEVETVKVSLNDNDIFCNIYGDSGNYKCFPDVGEFVKEKIVCASRRIHNNQLLFDIKRSNLRKINFTSDVPYFCNGKVTDIVIYSNKTLDEIEDNGFNQQIIKYLKMQNEYYTLVKERCEEIINSGCTYTKDIGYLYKRASEILNPDFKWREEDNSVFSNMVIEFVIERDIALSEGQKITGRFGNKGVISKIRPDIDMPTLETGEVVDIIFNTLGVINRLNSQQLFEQSITFICNRVKERLATLKTMKERETLLYRAISFFNTEEEAKLREYLGSISEEEKDQFFLQIQEEGIYIHIPPLWEKEPLFDRLRELYKEFDWIKPYDVYLNKFGRRIKIAKPLVVGDMYVIKLKQSSKKGFSSRSTGGLSKKGIPEKSNKDKLHTDIYSKTPIRIGDQENINSIIGVQPELVAQLHMFYRSSVFGRKDFGKRLAVSIDELPSFEMNDGYTNRNIEILQSYLRALGLKIEYSDDKMHIDFHTDEIKTFEDDDMLFIGTNGGFENKQIEKQVKKEFKDEGSFFYGTRDEYNGAVETEIEWRKRTKGKMVFKF